MLNLIYNLFIGLPLLIIKFSIYFVSAIFAGIYVLAKEIIIHILALFGLIFSNNGNNKYNKQQKNNIKVYNYYQEEPQPKKAKKTLSFKEEEFEKEAELWGLSEEDKRIAKEERMTPAEFIEAEERDDDELFTDE